MNENIDRHTLAALALAAHVRNVALDEGLTSDDITTGTLGGLGGGDHDQWREWYQCALQWASLEWEPHDRLPERVYKIVKNVMGNRWVKAPPGSIPG